MIKVIIFAIIGAFVSAMLRRVNPNYSYIAAIATGIIIITYLYVDIESLINVITTFSDGYGISDNNIKLLLKVLGISYLCQFGVSVAEDCGEKLIAHKIEFAGRLFIITLSVPILTNLLNSILSLV